ncbi:DUF423 domain-containing protein [Paraferrimonas sp. SM1919]|uniref:DUF423 domain-containing protein n=1 Tax=Paraferrimonas sp. SM1919 TaxID=2662263 RepID=UPI00196A03AF|nr:DUF423 domain-containing protein [Paraferrimonas sp. SM1919]
MQRMLLVAAPLLCGLAVIIGAWSAHGLSQLLSAKSLQTIELAVRYQFFHGLGLFMVALALAKWPSKLLQLAGLLMLIGTLLFSGSLYLLVATGVKWFGPVTPIGGLSLISAWLLISLAMAKAKLG